MHPPCSDCAVDTSSSLRHGGYTGELDIVKSELLLKVGQPAQWILNRRMTTRLWFLFTC